MSGEPSVAAALALALAACAHAPPGQIPSLDERARLGTIAVRGVPAAIEGEVADGERAATRAVSITGGATLGAVAGVGKVAPLASACASTMQNKLTAILFGPLICGATVVALPFAATAGAVAGGRAIAAVLPPVSPALGPAVRAGVGGWASATSADALLAAAAAGSGAGSGFALGVRDPGAAEVGGAAALDVSVVGAGLEWTGGLIGPGRFALFVDVTASLASGGTSLATLSVRVRDGEPYEEARWTSDAGHLVEARMPGLLRRAGGALVHEVLLSLGTPARRSLHGDAICGLGPMRPDGVPVEPSRAAELERAPDGRLRLTWEPWKLGRGTAPVTYDLRIWTMHAKEGDAPVITVDGLSTNSVRIASLDPAREYRFTVRAVSSSRGRRFVSRWWRRADGPPCSAVDAVAPPPDSLFAFRTPADAVAAQAP